ncbi:sulfoxide reductase heme-binding subunit YedZ [Gilvimarinus agarilyticus]|uniref:sulfite oxidase heme-binding subunit YedZ n=1 Tax=unclassified Gilvimarinus TaxID=2642066 RepID=UPI001C08864F|nr:MULTISPECIES: protein-methionine-sulfoxide reductase heme-binding subunit MsrQ [unclassified Gilvimarinus]MBU2887535.1 sulfoxide reductase heme-binding subunit YedZ [Gilvimarinus agarilyticus]MDO6572186.1 protein-methionine-sulfoxide reductase heme-binding subunit MsrQ [Gilvimarinus sp. 2_MG-2023]MDO6746750.1 protein-methionine-sulfoxide reductase heme-binding subunit MsrQ [Gilvimarinus sp. 1_MG-2023]
MKAVTWRRLFIFMVALAPFGWIFYRTISQQLGADPAKTIVLFTGEWAIYFLFASLAVTPLVRSAKWRWLMPHRRMLGLFALFYALCHVASYLVFILGLDFSRFFAELVKRPYITAGAPAVLILIALGATSTKAMMRRLGKRWQSLHRLVYVALGLAWVHVLWQVRSSYFEAVIYGILAALLLGYRLYWRQKMARKKAL